MRHTVHKVRLLLTAALLAGGLTGGFAAPTGAVVLCGPGETLDKGRCVPDEPDEPRRETRTVTTTTTTVRPIRTINEGQSTTFTAPSPSDRRLVTRCASFADERVAPTPKFRSDGTLVCDYSTEVEKRPGVTVSGNSISTFGPCRGPYTVEILTRDSRLEHTGGRRIRVTTSTSDNLDDSGSLEIVYFLVGTSTNTFQQSQPGAPVYTSTSECTLQETTRVEIRPARRPGMTAAVSRHAPPQEWLDGTTTSNWTCTQELLDYLAAQDPPIPAYCTLGDVVETTTKNEFRTPSRCVVIVTVARNGRGHGSTSCLPRSQAPPGWNSLPACPLSTDPDAMNALAGDNADENNRKRCVARN